MRKLITLTLAAALAASALATAPSAYAHPPNPKPKPAKPFTGPIMLTGTVTAVSGDRATVVLSNGQTVTINQDQLLDHGAGLTVGQSITLRGHYDKNGQFKAENPKFAAVPRPKPPHPAPPFPKGTVYLTGTVTAISGNRTTILLSNGQSVVVNHPAGLTIGQQVTLRGKYDKNGRFKPKNPVYTGFTGPYADSSIHGTIVSMNGNSLTIVRGLSLITINDSNAAARGAIRAGLSVGQSITAYGNWNGSVFYATSIQ